MRTTAKAARIAAALYLTIAVLAPFSLIYVPSALILPGDAAARWAREFPTLRPN